MATHGQKMEKMQQQTPLSFSLLAFWHSRHHPQNVPQRPLKGNCNSFLVGISKLTVGDVGHAAEWPLVPLLSAVALALAVAPAGAAAGALALAHVDSNLLRTVCALHLATCNPTGERKERLDLLPATDPSIGGGGGGRDKVALLGGVLGVKSGGYENRSLMPAGKHAISARCQHDRLRVRSEQISARLVRHACMSPW